MSYSFGMPIPEPATPPHQDLFGDKYLSPHALSTNYSPPNISHAPSFSSFHSSHPPSPNSPNTTLPSTLTPSGAPPYGGGAANELHMGLSTASVSSGGASHPRGRVDLPTQSGEHVSGLNSSQGLGGTQEDHGKCCCIIM